MAMKFGFHVFGAFPVVNSVSPADKIRMAKYSAVEVAAFLAAFYRLFDPTRNRLVLLNGMFMTK